MEHQGQGSWCEMGLMQDVEEWENPEVTGFPEEGTGDTVGKLGSIAIRVGVGQMGKSKL